MIIAPFDVHDIWYGKALLPVFTHKECRTISPMRGKVGCFRINQGRVLLVKNSKTKGKRVRSWQFTFPTQLRAFLDSRKRVFVFLICGNYVCAMKWIDAKTLMAYHDTSRTEWLYVSHRNAGYQVKGSRKDARMYAYPSSINRLVEHCFKW